MAFGVNKNKFNPFLTSPQVFNQNPVTPVAAPQKQAPGFVGATGNPFSKSTFAGLEGRTNNGLSFQRTEPGQMNLGNNAIKTPGGELGRKLFISM